MIWQAEAAEKLCFGVPVEWQSTTAMDAGSTGGGGGGGGGT